MCTDRSSVIVEIAGLVRHTMVEVGAADLVENKLAVVEILALEVHSCSKMS
jgi:hypothetical protein